MSSEHKNLARIFKALGDENRLRMLALVREGELECACGEDGCDETRCMTDLVERLGVSQATVSHHARELVDAGLISTRRRGRWVHCQIDKEGIRQLRGFLDKLIQSQPGSPDCEKEARKAKLGGMIV